MLRNFQQTKISAPPNLLEPIGFDQFPDGRIIQTARTGTVRLHNPATGTTQVIANFADPSVPLTQRIYTNSEDGVYGPAVDNNFATNKWVYLYYSPQTVVDVKLSDGTVVTQTTPNEAAPNFSSDPKQWDRYLGYFQLSRFKFVEDADGARLDLASEQQILRSRSTGRSAATSPATSTSTSTTTCGWSRVTTRRRAASTPAATGRSTTS